VVHILDVMTAKPGSLDEVRGLVHERYLPGAQARGMRLVGAWVAPSAAGGEQGGAAAAQRAEGERRRAPAEDWILLWAVADVAASLGSGS